MEIKGTLSIFSGLAGVKRNWELSGWKWDRNEYDFKNKIKLDVNIMHLGTGDVAIKALDRHLTLIINGGYKVPIMAAQSYFGITNLATNPRIIAAAVDGKVDEYVFYCICIEVGLLTFPKLVEASVKLRDLDGLLNTLIGYTS